MANSVKEIEQAEPSLPATAPVMIIVIIISVVAVSPFVLVVLVAFLPLVGITAEALDLFLKPILRLGRLTRLFLFGRKKLV